MPLRKIRKDINDLVALNHIQRAFLQLQEQLNPESSHYDDLIMAQSKFSRHCAGLQNGTLGWEDYEMGCTKAVQALIHLVKELTQQDLLFPNGFKIEAMISPNIESVLVRNSRQAHIHIAKARKLKKEKKYSESIAELRQAIELKPQSFASKTDLAALLRQTHQYDEAIEILQAILNECPRDTHSRNELAFCYRERYELDLATGVLQEGLKLVKTNNHFYTNLFTIHLFFSCQVEFALSIRKDYKDLTGEELIRDKPVRQKYDEFIHYFDDIHNGHANHEICCKYLDDCINNKRAYITAVNLLGKLLEIYPNTFWYQKLYKELPPQYR